MAQRNMRETAARVKGVRNDYYNISIGELKELADIARNEDVYEAFITCFEYGYVLGHRATIAGKYNEHK